MTALADRVAARLRKSEKLTDVFAAHGLAPSVQAVIDQGKLRQLGLHPQDVFNTLQVVSPTRGGIPLKDVDAVDIALPNELRPILSAENRRQQQENETDDERERPEFAGPHCA